MTKCWISFIIWVTLFDVCLLLRLLFACLSAGLYINIFLWLPPVGMIINSLCESLYILNCVPDCRAVYVCLNAYIIVSLFACLGVCTSAYIFVCLCAYLPNNPYFMTVSVSKWLSVCMLLALLNCRLPIGQLVMQ